MQGTGVVEDRNSSAPTNSAVSVQDVIHHQYATENYLQTCEVYLSQANASSASTTDPKYWIIYVHGGYYQSPMIDASSFSQTLTCLVSSPKYEKIRLSIAGYASINYRLAPHPESPQDPETTPAYDLRSAKHPDQIHDVITAIDMLQKRYGFEDRYLLVGHSVGATMAYQVALCQKVPWVPPLLALNAGPESPKIMRSKEELSLSTVDTEEDTLVILPPTGILGVEGIYDFPLIHRDFPGYVTMTRNGLGPDADPDDPYSTSSWARLSPACHTLDQYDQTWRNKPCSLHDTNKRLAMLAHSSGDTLVNWRQTDAMRVLFEGGSAAALERLDYDFRVVELQGNHNDVWQKNGGSELAKAIGAAVVALQGLGKEGDEKLFAEHV